jgi:hypothetical protein
MESGSNFRTKWGTRIVYAYITVSAAAIVLGYVAGAMIKRGDTGDVIGVISFFILFPPYIIADGILNSCFLWCPLRAAALPLVEGLAIWSVTGWHDPFTVSLIVAIIYVLVSLGVVGTTLSVRRLIN